MSHPVAHEQSLKLSVEQSILLQPTFRKLVLVYSLGNVSKIRIMEIVSFP